MRSSLGSGRRGPASRWTTRTPGSRVTTRSALRWSARVTRSHSTPARTSALANERTYTFIPPPSPVPGWANGDVCNESIATRLGDIRRPILVTGLDPFFRTPQRAVEVDQELLLALVEVGRGADRRLEVGRRRVVVAGIED